MSELTIKSGSSINNIKASGSLNGVIFSSNGVVRLAPVKKKRILKSNL